MLTKAVFHIFWPTVVTNENLWKLTKEGPVATAITRRKWKWIGHALRKDQVQQRGRLWTRTPRGSEEMVDQEQLGRDLLKKRPEKQERPGERSRAWLGTESTGDASWKPYAPKRSKRN
jgi:hypothetical protein